MRTATLVMAGAMACGGSARTETPVSPEYRSGTRLRAIVDRASDAALFVGWHDTELDVDCAWAAAADGAIRCVPVEGPGHIVYRDEGCAQPLYRMPSCEPAPALILRLPFSRDCAGWQVVRLGAAVPAPAIAVIPYRTNWAPDSIWCGSAEPSPLAPVTYRALGEPVDPSAFVAATVQAEPRGDRLRADVLRGDDGSIDGRSIFDLERQMRCDPVLEGIPSDRCAPHFVTNPDGEATACSYDHSLLRQVSRGADAFCGEPPGASEYTWIDAQWDLHRRYSEVGAPVTERVSTYVTGTCVWATGFYFIDIGGSIDATAFAPVSAVEEGSGRVRATAAVASTGERLRGAGFIDARIGDCVAARAGDGQLRCVPPESGKLETGLQGRQYADANCTVPVVDIPAGRAAPAIVSRLDPRTCPPITRVYGVASAPLSQSGLALYKLDYENACAPDVVSSEIEYRSTTGEVAPEMFAPITRSLE